jgi:hypothetical protein
VIEEETLDSYARTCIVFFDEYKDFESFSKEYRPAKFLLKHMQSRDLE